MPWTDVPGGNDPAHLSVLLALRHAAPLLRADFLVHQDHRRQGRVDPKQQPGQLGPTLRRQRAHGKLARDARRLVALTLALLGHAAAGLDLRAMRPAALRGLRRRARPDLERRPASALHRPGAAALRAMRRHDAAAQYHYPFENQELFKQRSPADFIAEGVDQTRGWFFSLLAIGTMLFNQPA